jgi:hypothetical protein
MNSSIKNIFVFLAVTMFIGSALGQVNKQPTFKVIELPNKLNYDPAQLDRDIGSFTTKEQVKQFLRLKNFGDAEILFLIHQPPNADIHWRINIGTNLDKEIIIVLQSKNLELEQINTESDFRRFFKDTLILLDPLKMDLYLNDTTFPVNQYFISYSSSQGKKTIKPIPFHNNQLIFTADLLKESNNGNGNVVIFNKKAPEKALSTTYLRFATPKEEETLNKIAQHYRQQNKNITEKEIADILSKYAEAAFGRVYYPQLKQYTIQAPTKPNGNRP